MPFRLFLTALIFVPAVALASKFHYKWVKIQSTEGHPIHVCIEYNKWGEMLGMADFSQCPGKSYFRWRQVQTTTGQSVHICIEYNAKGTTLGQADMSSCP